MSARGGKFCCLLYLMLLLSVREIYSGHALAALWLKEAGVCYGMWLYGCSKGDLIKSWFGFHDVATSATEKFSVN